MNAVHVYQRRGSAPSQAMHIKLDTLLNDVRVPRAETILTAKDELDGRIEQLDGFRPLVGFLGVVFFGHLADLPWAPGFVAERPVFDLWACQQVHTWEDMGT